VDAATDPPPLSREQRCELLAGAPAGPLVQLAEEALAGATAPTVVRPAETGTVVLQVREPVEGIRFELGDVLVTRAEVAWDGHRGWAMRPGDDRVAVLAAAVLDAEVERGGPLARGVLDLCASVAGLAHEARQREWDELSPTIVAFEELD
jgi:alpha-D-ribose 1-methylphosphonate 5-triphosphate synthase subunit PhnG